MSTVRTVVLDNEAVQALLDRHHRKHQQVLTAINALSPRPGSVGAAPRVVVPTAVRVEAGWNRRAPRAAVVNRTPVADVVLDGPVADRAAELRTALAVSVADAHLAATLVVEPGPFTVLTSDVDDVRRIAAHLDVRVTIIAI